jgi:hypothetical protein
VLRVVGVMRAFLLVMACTAAAHADDAKLPPARESLVLAPRFDPYCKTRGEPEAAQAFGLGVHYMGDFPPRQPFWYALGVDARVLTTDWTNVEGVAIGAVAKVTGGHAPPMTLELDAGAILSGDDSGAYVGGAALFSMLYIEVGYAYQRELGIDAQPWFGRHQLVIRGIIPVLTR